MFCNYVHFQMQKFQEDFQVLKSGQGRRSKEFFVKREEHHSNKLKELQTSSNKKLKDSATKLGGANATIEDLKKQLQSAINTIMARDDEISDLKGSLGEATKNNKKLEKEIVNLKTTHGEEKNGYELSTDNCDGGAKGHQFKFLRKDGSLHKSIKSALQSHNDEK